MNEDQIIALYQEFIEGIQQIRNSGQPIIESSEQGKKLASFEQITEELLVTAKEKGFGDKMTRNIRATVDESDDFDQMIDAAELTPLMRIRLKDSLRKWLSGEGNTRAKKEDERGARKIIHASVWKTISIISTHYKVNVLEVSVHVIPTRLKGDWDRLFGGTIEDLELVALAYQDSAEKAELTEIDNLLNNNWEASTSRLSAEFEKNFKGKKTWLLAANSVDNASAQFKLDLAELPLKDHQLKSISLTGGKIQLSGKLAFTSPVMASAQKKVLDEYVTFFAQGIRNTISSNTKELLNKGLFQGGSTTAGSIGITLNLGWITVTAKIDGGKTGWDETAAAVMDGKLGDMPTGYAVRLGMKVDIKKLLASSDLKNGINGSILNDSLCNLTVSGGWNVAVDWAEMAADALAIKNKTFDTNAKAKAKALADEDLAKQIQAHADDLIDTAGEMGDAIKEQKMGKLKKAAEAMKKIAKNMHDAFDKHIFDTKAAKDKVYDIMDKAGKKVYEKVAGPLSKLAKAFKFAKPLARLVPAVNAILTIIDVAVFAYQFVVWFQSVDANTWEDYFIAAGSYLEENFGWFDWLDRKMSR